jgi:hypothetical protein
MHIGDLYRWIGLNEFKKSRRPYLWHVRFAKYNENYQVKKGETGRTSSTHGAKRNAYRIMVGKPEEKKLLGRPRHR